MESAKFSSCEKEQSIIIEFFPKKLINLLNCEFDKIGLFKTYIFVFNFLVYKKFVK